MKKIFLASLALALAIGLAALPSASQAGNNQDKDTKSGAMSSRLSGRILLSVEKKGEAWYVNPSNKHRYFMGRPHDAFQLMRQFGLGISNKDFDSYNGMAPARLAGMILIKVEDSGKAYYVNPVDLKLYFLGTPFDAFQLMRGFGLGIKLHDLDQIVELENKFVSIANAAFSPMSLSVAKGTIVTWTNADDNDHTVTSSGNFDSSVIKPAKTYSHMFDKVGTYNYYDKTNSGVTGTIVVK